MIKVILSVLVLLFTVSGICDLLLFLRLFFLAPAKPFKTYTVVILSPDVCFSQLNTLLYKKMWYGKLYCDYIIAITDNLSYEQTEECIKIFGENNIVFCNELSLCGMLSVINTGEKDGQ